ncbi:MAG: TIGR04283 family arsenosugar biosynthesis glycosyltransferase [Candidatus Cyclobacteriaceae bacterium M2_1C_046]
MSDKEGVSVIIPVYNEEKCIRDLLIQLLQFNPYEIIVVDGGSTDNTCEVISEFNEIKLLTSKKGRAAQLNKGAEEASGNILLFLHADSSLSADALKHVESSLEEPHVMGGCFYLKFDNDNIWLRFFSVMGRINHSIFTYGDQGLFILKEHFNAMGGFKPMELLEDFEMQRRIRKSGRFIKLPVPITTSARRFCKNGILTQQIKNIIIVVLYLAGVSASRLAKYY